VYREQLSHIPQMGECIVCMVPGKIFAWPAKFVKKDKRSRNTQLCENAVVIVRLNMFSLMTTVLS
jgi:hypothetical protein